MRAQLETALRHPETVTDWPSAVREAAADVVREAAAGVVRLQALADDLLLLASHRATAPTGEPVDLAALAEDLVREYGHLPEAKGLKLTCEAPTEAVVRGNDTRLDASRPRTSGGAAGGTFPCVRSSVRLTHGVPAPARP